MQDMDRLSDIRRELRQAADPAKARLLAGFFKIGPGEYGADDRFLGVMVPESRRIAKRHGGAPLAVLDRLLGSAIHEERLVALLILVDRYAEGDAKTKTDAYRFYVSRFSRINNWDLVDLSAPRIVGQHLLNRSRTPLHRWTRSRHLWTRRIAVIATLAFIAHRDFADTLAIADRLLADRHDLIHKAVGWMLREVGKRSVAELESFLKPRYRRMPRTMLRYAIERLPERRRIAYLKGKI